MLAAALVAATTLVAAPPASRVEVVTADSCRGDLACDKYAQGRPVPVTTFVSGPGEANAVTVTRAGGELVFAHGAAPVRAVAPCRSDGPGTIRCPLTAGEPGIPGLAFAMGD